MKTGFYALLFLFTLGCGKAPKTLLLEGVVTDNSFNVPLSGIVVNPSPLGEGRVEEGKDDEDI